MSRRRPLRFRALLAALLASFAASAVSVERGYRTLRWQEDWSWLADEPATDAFDPVKHVQLGEEWWAGLGGSLRIRQEVDSNRTLGASPVDDDALQRLRVFLHGQVGRRKHFRWFWEVRWSDTLSEDRPVPAIFRDDTDVQNCFLEGTIGAETHHPVTVRVGRQELLLGAQRLVSPLDWSSTRRTFDGVTVTAKTPRTTTVVFATHPVAHEVHDIDSPIDEQLFAGVHVRGALNDRHSVEGYFYNQHDERDFASEADGSLDDLTRRTFGLRYVFGHAGWSVDAEGAVQDGHVGPDDIEAAFASLTVKRAWTDRRWKPALGFGLDVATGDSDPDDGDRETFDQLFPLGHAYFGHLDLVGRRNVRAARVDFSAVPRKNVKVVAALHRFWLEEERDALYGAGGAPIRRDVDGESGRSVGTELDVLIKWKANRHAVFALELSKWWSGDFIEATGSGRDAWFAWGAWGFTF